jgi:hypothetical protein
VEKILFAKESRSNDIGQWLQQDCTTVDHYCCFCYVMLKVVILFIYGGVHLKTVMMLLDAELLEPNAGCACKAGLSDVQTVYLDDHVTRSRKILDQ